jgi:hypothetical protein
MVANLAKIDTGGEFLRMFAKMPGASVSMVHLECPRVGSTQVEEGVWHPLP